MASQHSGHSVTPASLAQQVKCGRAVHILFTRYIVLAAAIGLLQLCAAQVSDPANDTNGGGGAALSSSMTAGGTPMAWCDYNCNTNLAGASGAFNITFQPSNSGSRIHTAKRYAYGNFSAMVKCPKGDITGLVPNFYTSSRETAGINSVQDEIDFEWLGRNKTIVQVNYYVNGSPLSFGVDNAVIVDLGFDCSDAFHEYRIDWTPIRIKWFIDDRLVHTNYNRTGWPYPTLPQFVYSSIWDASNITGGNWAGAQTAFRDAPYVFQIHSVKATELADITFNDNATTPEAPPAATLSPPATLAPKPSAVPTPTRAPTVPSMPVPPSPPIVPNYPGAMDAGAAAGLVVPLVVVSVVLLLLMGGFTWVVIQRKRAFADSAEMESGLVAAKAAGGNGGAPPSQPQSAPSRANWLRQLSARISMKREDMRKGSFTRINL